MNGHYDLIGYHPGADYFSESIQVVGDLWHITTPLGALSPRAHALSHPMTPEERQAMVDAAYPQLRRR